LIACVVLALVSLGFILGRTLSQRQDAETASGAALSPAVSQRIRDFHRVKVRDGRTVWELTADEAQYFEDEGKVLVTSPAVSFFGSDGQSVAVVGREGRVFVNGSEIQKIELGGGIEVKLGGYVVETEDAVYVQAQDAIVAPGRVKVTGTELSLDGVGMVVDLANQKVSLLRGVRTTLHGATPPPAATGAADAGVADRSTAARGATDVTAN
jgi:LPS export ABC transporter protein LptC